VCIPPPPPDLNCDDEGVPENFEVVGSDPHGFDGNDNDGIGCESGSNQPEAGEEEEEEEEVDDDGDDAEEDTDTTPATPATAPAA
jgi:hypothetical protein